MKTFSLTLSFFLASLCCFAQYTITGRVINQADTKPVAGANVFLSNTTLGAHTAADGSFTIANVKPGEYQLTVTNVGFDAYTHSVLINHADISLQPITIFPSSVKLNAVTISAKKGADPERPRYLEWFRAEFLGSTDSAKWCKILNPELLNFDYDNAANVLTAKSIDFLIIQNDLLGYKVKYLLKNFSLTFDEDQNHIFNFSGSVQFEPMKGTAAEEKRWQRNRRQFYDNSQMHFLRAAIAGTIDKENFRVLRIPGNPARPSDSLIQENLRIYGLLKNDKKYRDSLKYWEKKAALPKTLDKVDYTPLKKEDLLKGPDKSGFYTLVFNNDAYFITYNKDKHFNRSARSKLASAENLDNTLISYGHRTMRFDKNGSPVDPDGLVYDGIWIRGRVATLLPIDYEPQEEKMQVVDSALLKKITTKFTAYSQKNLVEKAYLHFDKPYYAAGDTIYFKAYLTQGETHQLSHTSGVLYAELINDRNKISNSIRMLVTDGVAWGDFALPRSQPKGNYRVRAYTQWMRNNGDDRLFTANIPVGSTMVIKPDSSARVTAKVQPKPAAIKPDIKFFAEGGSLVTGVRSKIAFKAIAANGLGVNAKGTITDNDNKEVATFTSTHLGMGYFYLTPADGKTYSAKVSYPNGTQDVIALPKSNDNTIGISVTDISRAFDVKISAGKQWFQQNKGKSYTLVIYSGGEPQSFTVKLDNPESDVEVVKNFIHTGIAKVTLFSADGEPLCERLLFVRTNDLLALNIKTDQSSYKPRSKTKIDLNAVTGENGPSSGHFSVSVVDERKVPADENMESTVVNNILLTSDLKGYVEQPNYYFTNVTEKTNADLDLVMLTHGYRSEWKKILANDNTPLAYRVEKGLSVGGQLKFGGKPLDKGMVKLFSKGKNGLMLDTLSDADGRFVFDNLAYNDSTKFVLQARTAKGQKDVEVKPDTAITTPEIAPMPGDSLQNDMLAAYVQHSKKLLDEQDKEGINSHTHMLKEVTVKDKKIDPFENSTNLYGKGSGDQTLTADELDKMGYQRLYDAVRAKAHGIVFTWDHKLRSNRAVLPSFKEQKQDYMLVIVDGIPIFNSDSPELISAGSGPLDGLEAADIENVEIFVGAHGSAIYGSRASGGVVIVTTKKARKINNYYKESPGVITFKVNGFYKQREFYSPKYEHAGADNKPDLRTTIYWNPEFTTDKDGDASLSYYNADGAGTYRVVIEGVDAEGNLGRQVLRYKVE